jgi:hypothetical protein
VSLLERIEHRLSSWIEGAFRRRIPRRVEPLEVGRTLLSAVDRHKRVSMACVYAPNKFTIILSQGDLEDMSSLARTLEGELKGVLQEKAEKDQLRFIGPLSVAFAADPELTSGQLQVRAEFCEGQCEELPSQEEPNVDTQVFRRQQILGGCLIVEVGRGASSPIPLKDGMAIGRSSQCDLVLDEPNVSRIHARISKRDGEWVIEDSNSTNGLFVNGTRVTAVPLKPGDQIQVGTAVLTYKESI